ncbi:hypothetical protein [Bacillus sp. FJAT-29814]|uniref:hypothetical protein n=1 Tax=Bacillus sp. FJAT-29814 TaxID=1729688 RepID=UPI00082D8853|nr:hypothetical protein [Bacillus sp. FJAT-29814]
MNSPDFKTFEEMLYQDCCRIIEQFTKTENNREVYSFCIYMTGHGDIVLFISTLESYNTTSERGRYYDIEEHPYGLRNNKYHFEDVSLHFRFSKEVEEFIYEEAQKIVLYEGWDPVINAAINVCNRLDEHYKLMDRTDDFIYLAAMHDRDYDFYIKLMKETVPLETLYAAFPEIARYDKLLEQLHPLSRDQQIAYWIKVYEDFLTGEESESVDYLISCRRNEYDVEDVLKSYKRDLSTRLLPLLLKYGKREEINHDFASLPKEERIKEGKTKHLSFWTKEGKITHKLIMLNEVKGNEEMIEPLHELLQFWFAKTNSYPYDSIGHNVRLLAHALRSIAPDRFPFPSTDNGGRLKNYKEFHLSLDI